MVSGEAEQQQAAQNNYVLNIFVVPMRFRSLASASQKIGALELVRLTSVADRKLI